MSQTPRRTGHPDFDAAVDRALAEYFRRRDAGEPIDRDGFLAAHPPEVQEGLRSFLQGDNLLDVLGQPRRGEPADAAVTPEATIPPQGVLDTDHSAAAHAGTAHDIPVPHSGERYRIVRTLGKGAMGEVYLAEDCNLERPVALKVPMLEGGNASDMLRRFEREARIVAALRHPNICPIYDVGRMSSGPLQGQPFLAMAYIEGETLQQRIDSGKPFSRTAILQTVRKIAQGLGAAHQKNIIHRDLKPANIMLDQRGEPMVMDFGLARSNSGEMSSLGTQDGTVLGTPAFMSPEQVNGEISRIGPHTDVWALGVILYELLTGQLPFQGAVGKILGHIVAGKLKPPSQIKPDVDPALDALCMKMLTKKIEDRCPTMEAVVKELTAIAKGATPAAAVASVASQKKPGEKAKVLTSADAESLYNAARRCHARHDYAEVIRLIDEIPASLRTPVMETLHAQATEAQAEVDSLQQDIAHAMAIRDPHLLRPAVERLLELKPGDKRAQNILSRLKGGGRAEDDDELGAIAPAEGLMTGMGRNVRLAVCVFVAAFIGMTLWIRSYLKDSERDSPPPPPPPLIVGPILNPNSDVQPQTGIPFPTHPLFEEVNRKVRWTPLEVTAFAAEGGAVVDKLDDQSVRVVGPNPDRDTYTVTTNCPLKTITGIRLEALPDGANGPGRAGHLQFLLTELEVGFADAPPFEVSSGIADYSQWPHMAESLATRPAGSPALRATVDQTGWAVDAHIAGNRVPRAAIFSIEKPQPNPGGKPLQFVFRHKAPWAQHNLARIRLLATSDAISIPFDPTGANRRVAEWSLKNRSSVEAVGRGFARHLVGDAAALPREDFAIHQIRLKGPVTLPDTILNDVKQLSRLRGVHVDGDVTNLAQLISAAGFLPSMSFVATEIQDDTSVAISRHPELRSLELLNCSGAGNRKLPYDEMKQLASLTVSSTGLSEEAQGRISRCPSLSYLRLYSTGASDALFTSEGQWPFLNELTLSGASDVTTNGIRRLASIQNVETLMLPTAGVKNDFLANLSAYPKLQTLNLTATKVTPDGFPELSKATRLRSLYLSALKLADADTEKIPTLDRLRELHFGNDSVTESGIKKLQDRMPYLKVVAWANSTSKEYPPRQTPLADLSPPPANARLKMEIFRDKELSPKEKLAETKAATINSVDWPGMPYSGMPGGSFSVRWTGRLVVPTAGKCVLTAVSDDGMRVWLDDKLVIDDWIHHPERAKSVTLDLQKRNYDLKVEFYELWVGGWKAQLKWKPPGRSLEEVIPATAFAEPGMDSQPNPKTASAGPIPSITNARIADWNFAISDDKAVAAGQVIGPDGQSARLNDSAGNRNVGRVAFHGGTGPAYVRFSPEFPNQDGCGVQTGKTHGCFWFPESGEETRPNKDFSVWTRVRIENLPGAEQVWCCRPKRWGLGLRADGRIHTTFSTTTGIRDLWNSTGPDATPFRGRWLDVGFSFSGDGGDNQPDVVALFVNGEEAKRTTFHGVLDRLDHFHLGAAEQGSMPAEATFDRVVCFDRALSAEEFRLLSQDRQTRTTPQPENMAPDPGNLVAYYDRVGQSFEFQVTGRVGPGNIWGSDVYTTDSALAIVSVHAGVLKAGQTGVVKATIVAPPKSFSGTSRHGVTSSSYNVFPGAYRVELVRLTESQTSSTSSEFVARFRNRLAIKSSSFWTGWSADKMFDGNLQSSWFSANGDSAARGRSPWVEATFPEDIQVGAVTVFSIREPGYEASFEGLSVITGEIQLFRANGQRLASARANADPKTRDIHFRLDKPVSNVRRVRFLSIVDRGQNSWDDIALGEMEIYSNIDDRRAVPPETAAAAAPPSTTPKPIGRLPLLSAVNAATVSPDGRTVATFNYRENAHQTKVQVWKWTGSTKPLSTIDLGFAPEFLRFSADGSLYLAARREVWEVRNSAAGAVVGKFQEKDYRFHDASFAADLQRVSLCGTEPGRSAASGGSILLATSSGGKVSSVHFDESNRGLFGGAFSPDGRFYASRRSFDRQDGASPGLRIWSTASGKPIASLEGPDVRYDVIEFSPSGMQVAASVEKTSSLLVWNASGGKPVYTVRLMEAPRSPAPASLNEIAVSKRLAFDQAGRTLALATKTSLIVLDAQTGVETGAKLRIPATGPLPAIGHLRETQEYFVVDLDGAVYLLPTDPKATPSIAALPSA